MQFCMYVYVNFFIFFDINMDNYEINIEQVNVHTPNHRKWCLLCGLICWLVFPVTLLTTLVCGNRCLPDTEQYHVMMTVLVGIFGLVTCIGSTICLCAEFHPHFQSQQDNEDDQN